MISTAAVWAVIPAAGIGSRMAADRPKQYLPLAGKLVIEHTLERLCNLPGLAGIYVGLAAHDTYWPTLTGEISRKSMIHVFEGGAERADTVLRGLQALLSDGVARDQWVLVHDAARPCVDIQLVQRLIAFAQDSGNGAILGMPISDTVKRVGDDGIIQETVPRDGLWRAQTPQMFRLGMLHDAIIQATADGFNVTDEASAIEYAGHTVCMLEGQATNIKITVPDDLAQAERCLTR